MCDNSSMVSLFLSNDFRENACFFILKTKQKNTPKMCTFLNYTSKNVPHSTNEKQNTQKGKTNIEESLLISIARIRI